MSHRQLLLLVLIALLSPATLAAAPLHKTPGATVIVPYFEVDLDAADGRTTLISVGNVGPPVVARATLWSDWGVPVYAWNIYLGQNALATYNLRDILVFGNVAPTRAPAGFGGCGDPVATPALAGAELATLQKRLTGQDLGGDRCDSQPREDPTLATGSLTIDTVTGCRNATSSPFPNEPGYYFSGGIPLASARQDLWGDFTLVDPANNFAEGFEAPTLGLAGNPFVPRFGELSANPEVAREALSEYPACSRLRFLQGGPFSARTSFFVYMAPPQYNEPSSCDGQSVRTRWSFWIFDEAGQAQSTLSMDAGLRRSARIEAGEDLNVGLSAGYIQWITYLSGDWGGIPEPDTPIQHLLLGAIEASGRFAVGIHGNALGLACH